MDRARGAFERNGRTDLAVGFVQEFVNGRWHDVEVTKFKDKADRLVKAGEKRRIEEIRKRVRR
jgi:hypothetical protein